MSPAGRCAASPAPSARNLAALAAASFVAARRRHGARRQAPPAQAPRVFPKVTFTVTRAASEIKVDGVLDEEAWKTAAVVPLPYEWAPGRQCAPAGRDRVPGHLRREEPLRGLPRARPEAG